ncbi:MAG: arginase family protein [Gaiellaceae bacterium]
MSTLRARCPACRTLTAVAIGPEYECHSCGRTFGAGLVRVPRAWGRGGEAMAAAASLPIGFPEVAVVEEGSLPEQSLAVAAQLPQRPVILGGCCCAHVGVVEGLAARHERLAVVWLDAHGDLNTIESSPSGNPWATPLRVLIDSGVVGSDDVALVGARNLDPPEEAFIAEHGVRIGPEGVAAAVAGADAVYVALDADVLDEGEVRSFMPEPGGLSVDAVAGLFRDLAASTVVAGAGISALAPDPAAVPALERLCAALGLEPGAQ